MIKNHGLLFSIGDLVKRSLCEPEQQLFTQAVDKVIEQNEENQPDQTYLMLFNGEKYLHSQRVMYSGIQAKTLRIEFVPEFLSALQQWKTVQRDIQQIWQTLLPLCSVVSNQITRNAFPEELVGLFTALSAYPRTEEQSIHISKLTAVEQSRYHKMLPKLQYYISLRMLV